MTRQQRNNLEEPRRKTCEGQPPQEILAGWYSKYRCDKKKIVAGWQ